MEFLISKIYKAKKLGYISFQSRTHLFTLRFIAESQTTFDHVILEISFSPHVIAKLLK